MASATGLSRTRSLRKPAGQLTQKDVKPAQDETKTKPKPSGTTSPSRLPQAKPLTRSATSITSTTTSSTSAAARTRAGSSATGTTTTASGRPLSGIFSSRPTTTRRPSPPTDQTAPAAATAAAKPLGRAPSTRRVPSGASTSSVSRRDPAPGAARPTSSGGLPSSKPRVLGHSRAKSTATTLTSATTLRPPGAAATTASSSSTASANTSKPQTRARTVSQATSQAASTTNTAAAAAQHRPAFNTNQQHYSPLKSHAPKPLTSTYLAPPSPSKLPTNVAISAETSRLQTELLQLSLLHRDAQAVTLQWHESARRNLGARFRQLVAEDEALCAAERDGVESRNAAALLQWAQQQSPQARHGGAPVGLEEKVQALDQVLSGVWSLGEPGGRYARVVAAFEDWADRMAGIVAAQRDSRPTRGLAADGDRGGVMFISELDCAWKGECAGLKRKLEAWRRTLTELGPAPGDQEGRMPRSSLARVLDGCASLVYDMLEELELMEQMEREARRAEDEWMEKMLHEELKIGEDEAMDKEVPLWKLVI
ncbi:hypothetical protein JX266_001026 [Neoarthrinium moseri]|nr:hypothetical protein JX266_001026 [Neoarthrinium moseri]